MKFSKRFRWMVVGVALCVFSVLFLMWNNSVGAAFSNVHAFIVIARVETEIMQKTPAGQYYESLFWKHNDEVMQILQNHPERRESYWHVTRLFIPELEALLNGNGKNAYITSEHIESLKTELDWYASVGSPAFREDIQKEQKRFPLDAFVGMTMSDALDFINSNWSPDSSVEKKLVPDSDGKWAYYIHDGVYLEYPIQYSIQISESEEDYAYFIPSTGMPEQWHPFVMKVKVWNVPSDENNPVDVHSWYSSENVLWEIPVQTAEFQGFEFIKTHVNSTTMNAHAFLYNQENQLALDIWVFIFESLPQDGLIDYFGMINQSLPQNGSIDYFSMVNQRYEYFQHMVDHVRIERP